MLTRSDALSAFLWVAFCAGAMLLVEDPRRSLLMLALVSIIVLTDRGAGLLRVVRHLKLLLLLPAALFFFHAILHAGADSVAWGPVAVSKEGARTGALVALRVATVVLASLAFIWTADFRELLAGLVRFGLPYQIAFTVFFGLRYIPVMEAEKRSIVEGIAVRKQGRNVGPRRRFGLWLRYLQALVINGLLKAEQAAVALEIRGFGAGRTRSFERPHRFTPAGLLLMAITVVLGALLVVSASTSPT